MNTSRCFFLLIFNQSLCLSVSAFQRFLAPYYWHLVHIHQCTNIRLLNTPYATEFIHSLEFCEHVRLYVCVHGEARVRTRNSFDVMCSRKLFHHFKQWTIEQASSLFSLSVSLDGMLSLVLPLLLLSQFSFVSHSIRSSLALLLYVVSSWISNQNHAHTHVKPISFKPRLFTLD